MASSDRSHSLTGHILWLFTSSDRSHPLICHIPWQVTSTDIVHPRTGHILWYCTSTDRSHPLKVHIIWQFTSSDSSYLVDLRVFLSNPIICDSLLYLLAYYPSPTYNNCNCFKIFFFSIFKWYIKLPMCPKETYTNVSEEDNYTLLCLPLSC